jgi:hypothetical protein
MGAELFEARLFYLVLLHLVAKILIDLTKLQI